MFTSQHPSGKTTLVSKKPPTGTRARVLTHP